MRLHLIIACVALLAGGCRSAHTPGDRSGSIAQSLERQITADEAHRIAHSYLIAAIQAAQARSSTNADSRDELRILRSHHQRSVSRLESFLSLKKSGDELWTYLTAGPRCRESGFALLRDGHVVHCVKMMILD